MAINYAVAVKTERMTITRDHFADGTLEIRDSADNVIVTFDLTAVGGTVVDDTWTLAFAATTVPAAAEGIAAKAVLKTAGDSADMTGLTVGEESADVLVDNVNINAGQKVLVNSAAFQHS